VRNPTYVKIVVLMLTLASGTFSLAVAQGKAVSPEGQKSAAQVVVGPNILVSKDGDIPHVEVHSAINPQNRRNIITSAITLTSAEGGWATKVYATQDGGVSWSDVRFPEEHQTGGGDPQVAFGIHGTAYHATLNSVKDESGTSRARLLFYRSEDGGLTWNKPTDLGIGNDHDMVAVDHSVGRYAGRVYITSLSASDYPIYRIRVYRSDDDGRTFIGPAEATNGGGKIGINTLTNIVVLRNGTLVIPYVEFEIDPAKTKKSGSLNLFVVSSTDGGVTFSQPTKVGAQQYDIESDETRPLFTIPTVAADVSKAFPDRIYMAWSDFRKRKYRMVASYSSDRGKTWTTPIEVDPGAPADAQQYQPAIATNKDGVLAVTWFDTRNGANAWRYDQYAALSTNGGESFLPAVRVSSESSNPGGEGNQALIPSALVIQDRLTLNFTSAFSRWAAGGDYMGLSADSNGDFYSFWADSRSGTFQVAGAKISLRSEVNASAGTTNQRQLTETELTRRVELKFGATKYDSATKTLELPVLIKNISKETIYGPLHLQIPKIGGVFEWEDAQADKQLEPAVLNATNKKSSAGAQFDFTSALGSGGALRPGEITSPITCKLRLVDPNRVPTIELRVIGQVEK